MIKISTIWLTLVFIGVVGVSSGQDFVKDGLVCYWTFDSVMVSGNIVKDVISQISGEMHDVEIVEGKIKEGARFNGSSSYIEIALDERLDITDAISVDAWMKMSQWQADPNRNVIIARYNAGANQRYVQFSLNPSNGLATYLGHTNGTAYAQTQKGTVNTEWVGKWVHVAFTWDHSDDGLSRLYVDGEEVESYMNQEALRDPLTVFDIPWIIGAMPNIGRFFAGILDELRIYNRRLSDDEVFTNSVAQSNIPVDLRGKLAMKWADLRNR